MFKINDDMSIYATRGDSIAFSLTVDASGVPYKFKDGDIVRFKVFEKKEVKAVVLDKEFATEVGADKVSITLTGEDTKIGEYINKPKDYWYEIELNPITMPQTIVGYDEAGPKVFRLFPEGGE